MANVIKMVSKYIIKDLTGLVENYYIQKDEWAKGELGHWDDGDYRDEEYVSFRAVCRGGHVEYMEHLFDDMDPPLEKGLYEACRGGHLNIVKPLVYWGADKYLEGIDVASEQGYDEIVEFLFTSIANRELTTACRFGQMNIVKLMIEKGANDLDEGLEFACWGGHIEIVKLLLEAGAKNLEAGLQTASKQKYTDLVQFLSEEIEKRRN